MAIENFKRTVWHKTIQTQLDEITSLKNHCNFDYEGDCKYAERIKVLNISAPTIRDYVPGTDLITENVKDGSVFIDIDQRKYYDIFMDSVDKVQAQQGGIEKATELGSKALSNEADKFVAKLIKDEKANIASGSSVDISGATDGGIAMLEGGFQKLYENNCQPTDTFYLEISPAWYTIFRPEIIELDTNNSELIKKGFVGKYGNALISIENLLPTWNDGTRDCELNILRTNKAVAFVGQLDTVEAFKPEKAFGEAVKALYVFGGKVIRPEQIYLFPLY